MTIHDPVDQVKAVEQLLLDMGGFYTFADILTAVNQGRMQSFSFGASWIVTQVDNFPQKTVLEMVLAVGDPDELEQCLTDVEGFARVVGAEASICTARLGWKPQAARNGYKLVMGFYYKELV